MADKTSPRRGFILISPVIDILRQVVRSLRRAGNRFTHSARHRRAIARLESLPRTNSFLFVCHGNICRSPYAAAALRSSLGSSSIDERRATSAGFVGSGRPSPSEALDVAAERGVDLSRHWSQMVSAEIVRGADVILVMNAAQQAALRMRFRCSDKVLVFGDLDPHSNGSREILDPINKPVAAFRDSYDRIDRCLHTLAEIIGTHRGRT